jgi:hypothetical protein
MLFLSSIDHRMQVVAQQIHAVQMAAYKQEAKLLGVDRFPPLERRVAELLASSEDFMAAFEGETLAGVLSVGPDDEGRRLARSRINGLLRSFPGRDRGTASAV